MTIEEKREIAWHFFRTVCMLADKPFMPTLEDVRVYFSQRKNGVENDFFALYRHDLKRINRGNVVRVEKTGQAHVEILCF